MISHQRERLTDALIQELEPLLVEHWKEVALNQDTVRLDPDWDMMKKLDVLDIFVVMTARADGKLVGYASYTIAKNLHYQSLNVAEGDVFWLHPDYRKGLTGVKLLKAGETFCRSAGCNKFVLKMKNHIRTLGPVFERLGYKPIETFYAKTVL